MCSFVSGWMLICMLSCLFACLLVCVLAPVWLAVCMHAGLFVRLRVGLCGRLCLVGWRAGLFACWFVC